MSKNTRRLVLTFVLFFVALTLIPVGHAVRSSKRIESKSNNHARKTAQPLDLSASFLGNVNSLFVLNKAAGAGGYQPANPLVEMIDTREQTCATLKTDFNLSEIVCARATGAAGLNDRFQWVDPNNSVRFMGPNITTDPQTTTFTLPATKTTTIGGTTVVENRGSWTATITANSDGSQRASSRFRVHDPANPAANLDVSGHSNDASSGVTAGNNVTFSVFLRNHGPDAAQNATFTDVLPGLTTFVSLTSPAGWTCSTPPVGTNGTITCTKVSVAAEPLTADTPEVFTVVANVPTTTRNQTQLTNVASITSSTEDQRPNDNTSASGTTVTSATTGAAINQNGASLTVEGCSSPNSVVDPGESVTFQICIQNNGNAATTNLVGTLQATGNVTNPGGAQTFGAVAAGGGACKTFTFTGANVACGSILVPSVAFQDGATNFGAVVFNSPLQLMGVASGGGVGIFQCCVTPAPTVGGTSGSDTLIVNASGPNSGSYTLNGAPAVAFSGITTFSFDGLGGDDLLQINNPAGDLFRPSGGISYNGGGQSNDRLENLGGTANSGFYTVGPTNDAGTLSHSAAGGTQTITFTGLAPTTDTVAEGNFTVNAPDTANAITLDNGTANGDGLLRVSIDAFEPVQFANKTTLTIIGGLGAGDLADTINVNYTEISTGLTAVSVLGGEGGDIFNVQATAAAAPASLSGDNGNDQFLFANGATLNGGTINGGAAADILDYTAYTTSVSANLGLNVTGLSGNLDGDQETPATTSTATGTATVSNYNINTHTFDINVTVTGIPLAQVTGFHIHRAPFGVSGSIIVFLDAPGVGTFTPTVDGFTYTATSVLLPAQHEAAFLGGITYVNVHTAASPSGAIRGQLFSTGNVNLGTGAGTGVTAVTNVENLTGSGGGDDSLVGSFSVNQMAGNNGNDTMLGGPGADSVFGGGGDDVLAWNNGDGSDVLEGGNNNDVVQVNGSPTVGDAFTIGAGAGGRVAFARTSPAPFTLDIGTTETLTVNGIGGAAPADSFAVFNLTGVTNLTSLNLNGLDEDDTFDASTGAGFSGTMTFQGGRGADTIIGSPGADIIRGGDHADTIRGGPGADQIFGGPGSDTFNWFPGDGSDLIEGGPGVDLLNFTGAGAGEIFTLNAVGPRVELLRNLANIDMDIGTTETIEIDALAGQDIFNVNSLAGVADLSLIDLLGGADNDTFNIVPAPAAEIHVHGGDPIPPASPGDSLFIDFTGTTNPNVVGFASGASGLSGTFTFGNRQPVTFEQIETLPSAALINDVSVTEGNSGSTNAVFTVTLLSTPAQTVTIDYFTSNGTAMEPSDYTNTHGTLTFAPGVTSRTISVPINGDTIPEGDETFFVNLMNPTNAVLADTQAVGTILNDDAGSALNFSAASYGVDEAAGLATISVTRAGSTLGTVTVNFATSNSSATAGSDYGNTSGTLTFGPGVTTQTFTIPIVDDLVVEGTESVNLTLSAPTGGAVLGTQNTASLFIIDNDTSAPDIYAVTTTNNLLRFNSNLPEVILSSVPITGLQSGENVLGIDFRSATGQLYALGSTSRLYTIDTSTGAATQIGSSGAFALSGTEFGFDFNPVPDRIRVVSDADQNLRLNPNNATLTMIDTPLAYAGGDPNVGANPNVTGSAYTNSFAGATATTLFGIDSNLDVLVIQNPPNDGTLNTVGPLFVDTTGLVGFDIRPIGNVAYASFTLPADSSSKLYTIDLTTGHATFVGTVDSGQLIRDIAVVPAVFQLSSASYSVNEGAGAITITVNRSGDVGVPAFVNYQTSDTAGLQSCTTFNGKASERCDYVTSIGTLTYGPGELSKTFTVPIEDDVWVEGSETFTVSLTSPTGVGIGSATVTILDNDSSAPTSNPIDGVDFFVRQQYLDFLGRLPDTVGFQNWVNTLSGCPNGGFGEPPTSNCDRLHVVSGFLQSQEFFNRGYFIFRFYMVSFNARPTYTQFIRDMAFVGGPKTPAGEEAAKVAFANAFVLRPEFLAAYPGLSGQPLANALLATAGLPGPYTAGAQTNAEILRGIAESSQAFNKFLTEGTVSMLYFALQRRDPDSSGYANNVATLNANPSNLRHMIFIFIYSTEYRQRFGPA